MLSSKETPRRDKTSSAPNAPSISIGSHTHTRKESYDQHAPIGGGIIHPSAGYRRSAARKRAIRNTRKEACDCNNNKNETKQNIHHPPKRKSRVVMLLWLVCAGEREFHFHYIPIPFYCLRFFFVCLVGNVCYNPYPILVAQLRFFLRKLYAFG